MLTINHALLKDLERFGDGRHRGVALHPFIKTQYSKTLCQPGRSIVKQCVRLLLVGANGPLQDLPGIHAEDVSKALISRLLELIHRIGLDVIGNHQSNS